MPDLVPFSAETRTLTGKAAKRLRKRGIVPGNIFGGARESEAIQVNAHDIERFLAAHTPTTILRMSLNGAKNVRNVVVSHVQHQPVTHEIQHIDFMLVQLDQPIKAKVPIHVVGEAPAMKIGGTVMLNLMEAVDVEARPVDLPPALDLDVSGLRELKSALHVSDLRPPPGVTILTDEAEPVVKIEPSKLSRAEGEIAAAAGPVPPQAAAAESPEIPAQ
jgi:large subunit ribosomal protein L25